MVYIEIMEFTGYPVAQAVTADHSGRVGMMEGSVTCRQFTQTQS